MFILVPAAWHNVGAFVDVAARARTRYKNCISLVYAHRLLAASMTSGDVRVALRGVLL